MKLTTIYCKLLNESLGENNNQKQNLSKVDQQVISFILGETLDEADGNKIINRLLSLIDSGKRNLITGAVIATLLASSSFNSALAQSPQNVKAKIEQAFNSNTSSSKEDLKGGIKLKNSVYVDSFNNNFPSGSYELNSNDVTAQLTKLKEFLKNNPNNDYEIRITASESQVPNQNNLKVGELASKRAKSLSSIIKQFLVDNNIQNISVNPQIRVGDVKWDGSDKNDEKFTKDQFVQMDVIVIKGEPEKKGFTKTGKQATSDNDYVDSVEQLNGDGEVTLSPGWIPDRLVIYQGGKITHDTGYFVDKKMASQYQEWNFTPKHIASLTKMLVDSPNSDASKVNTIKTFNDFNELVSFMLKNKKHNYKMDTRREVKEGLLELKQLWDAGQRDFMFYSAKSGKVDFKLTPGSSGELKVFSPVKDTQFSYSGYQIINGKRVSLEKTK